MLQKSSTFSSLSGVVPVNKPKNKLPGSNLGSWFDRRAKKLSMKCSRSITLGESVIRGVVLGALFWPFLGLFGSNSNYGGLVLHSGSRFKGVTTS